MTKTHRTGLTKIALSVAIALATLPSLAQNTTSAIGGRITGSDGKALAGAQITIVHNASGSTNNTLTDADGRYNARGLRTGGPYTITITKAGVTEKRENVYLQLAETATLMPNWAAAHKRSIRWWSLARQAVRTNSAIPTSVPALA